MQYDAIESVTTVAYLNAMSIGDENDIIYQDDIFKEKSPWRQKNISHSFIRHGILFIYPF